MKRLPHLVGLLVLVLVAVATVASIRAPNDLPLRAPETEFSAGRAYEHFETIAARPHPLGSRDHEKVRGYLVDHLTKLGLDVRVQEAQTAARVVGMVWSARVHNVVARLPGTRSRGPAVMLAAHYDTVPQSRGASDDGFGVVTLLETARALRAGPPLANDVLFVFTDGEELALRGAQAVADDAELVSTIGVVLNFEARGTEGAVAMFETSNESGPLLHAFGAAAPHPVGSSIITALAAALPNGTDSLVWKQTGLPVLGFAYADRLEHYHRFTDDPSHIHSGSLQHGGEYALTLTRWLGDADLARLRGPDVVYFDLFGRVLVRTSTTFARILALLSLVFFFAVVLRAQRRDWRGLAKGAGLWLTVVAAATAASLASYMLVVSRLVDFYMLVSRARFFVAHALLLGGAVILAVSALWLRRADRRSIAVGAMIPWALGLGVTAVIAPTLTAPLEWPLLFAMIGGVVAERRGLPIALYLGLCPAVSVLTNLVYALFIAAGATMPFAPVAMLALLGTLLVPVIAEAPAKARWYGSGGALVLSAIVLLVGWRAARYGDDEPYSDTLYYALDHDTGEARWVTWGATDPWVTKRVPRSAAPTPLPGFLRSNRPITNAPAPPLELSPAEVSVRSDTTENGERRLVLHVASPRRARCLRLWDAGGARIVWSPEIDGRKVVDFYRISPEADEDAMRRMTGDASFRVWRMTHCGLGDSGLDLTLTAKAEGPVKLRIVEESEELPDTGEGPMPPRPKYLIPAEDSDVTLVGRTVTL